MTKIEFECYVLKYERPCSNGCKEWLYKKDIFKDQDNYKVPLVWDYDNFLRHPESCIGHAILENRNDGVYANCMLLTENKEILSAIEKSIELEVLQLAPFVTKVDAIEGVISKGYISSVSLITDRVDRDEAYTPILKKLERNN